MKNRIDKNRLKMLMKENRKSVRILSKIYNSLIFNNSISISKTNRLDLNGFLRGCHISIRGKKNIIIVKDMARLFCVSITISGNNNIIMIGENVYIENAEIYIEDDRGMILVGDSTIISSKAHLACIEGTKIDIGENCLFSANITIRTGDSHSIVDINTGKRINPSKSVKIGNHVWIGNGATILKGVNILKDCVIGSCAVVTHSPQEGNCVLAGNPAKVVKTGIGWEAERRTTV